MSVDELLKKLYQQGFLSKSQVLKVKGQLAKNPRTASLESVQRGLVNSRLVTQEQIDVVLQGASPQRKPKDDIFVVDDTDEEVLDLLPVDPQSQPSPAPGPILPELGDLLSGTNPGKKKPMERSDVQGIAEQLTEANDASDDQVPFDAR
ncbi:MAG: hypothetical protein O2931_11875, partial [Planctomycetota bacterium]|nr:hypothetical protein [Planctomycetota bacterium]